MLRINYSAVTENMQIPFSFFQWFTKDDGHYNVKATLTDKATKTIEQLLFIKTVDILTVYRCFDEKTAIFQCRLGFNMIAHNDIKLYRVGDGDVRFLIQEWIKQG